MELLRDTWPILLTLLLQVFVGRQSSSSSSTDQQEISNAVNPNLVLAALKLIEHISYVQLEEFYFHQWMFVLDCMRERATLPFSLPSQDS